MIFTPLEILFFMKYPPSLLESSLLRECAAVAVAATVEKHGLFTVRSCRNLQPCNDTAQTHFVK